MKNTHNLIRSQIIAISFVFLMLTIGLASAVSGGPLISGPNAGTPRSTIEWNPDVSRYTFPPGVYRMPSTGQARVRAETVIDRTLLAHLDTTGSSHESVDVIIQYMTPLTASDRSLLETLDAHVKYEFESVYAIAGSMPAFAIDILANNDRIYWMELDEPLNFNMDLSLTTINATDAWQSEVIDAQGRVMPQHIDGTGITAIVLDSGIDAGHPDLDYGTKTIKNLKSDINMIWTEVINGDTSSGHGTHCAGTVAGNGDASAGARRGVAPGANLIGLSTGEGPMITNAVGGLEWVYENTRPNANPYNARVVSNSWGAGGGEYDQQDIISELINKITFENNVVTVFAAGNSGGDGSDIQSGNYANTPASVCVAALERDGSGVASFSSRGMEDTNSTFPDIGAPGVKIWSTAARRTMISAMTKQTSPDLINPYYFAISGTSMATPHVSGLIALLWQAAPSLGVSERRDDYQGDDDTWWDREDTRIHEAEEILEASARYIPPGNENGVPVTGNDTMGWTGLPYDLAQGYGMINAEDAVGIALTLQELRTRDSDGDRMSDMWEFLNGLDPAMADGDMDKDHDGQSNLEEYVQGTSPSGGEAAVTVAVPHAVDLYRSIMKQQPITSFTSVLHHKWEGEWTRFTNQSNKPNIFDTDQAHMVYIPENAVNLNIDLQYDAASGVSGGFGTLSVVIDTNMDGSVDWRMTEFSINGHKEAVIPIQGDLASKTGTHWNFNIEGRGFEIPIIDIREGNQYGEARSEYVISLEISLDIPAGDTYNVNDLSSNPNSGQWSFSSEAEGPYAIAPTQEGTAPGGTYHALQLNRKVYDLSSLEIPQAYRKSEKKPVSIWRLLPLLVVAFVALGAIAGYKIYRESQKKKDDGI